MVRKKRKKLNFKSLRKWPSWPWHPWPAHSLNLPGAMFSDTSSSDPADHIQFWRPSKQCPLSRLQCPSAPHRPHRRFDVVDQGWPRLRSTAQNHHTFESVLRFRLRSKVRGEVSDGRPQPLVKPDLPSRQLAVILYETTYVRPQGFFWAYIQENLRKYFSVFLSFSIFKLSFWIFRWNFCLLKLRFCIFWIGFSWHSCIKMWF